VPTARAKNLPFVQIFPFDEKCSDFAEVRRFSLEKRMQFREIWAFIGNSRPYPRASGKTNLTKSAHSRLTARESSEKLPYLLFAASEAVHRYCEMPQTKRHKALIKAENLKSVQNTEISPTPYKTRAANRVIYANLSLFPILYFCSAEGSDGEDITRSFAEDSLHTVLIFI